jgi:formylglycine-generating enzyme required for sulfatase activity
VGAEKNARLFLWFSGHCATVDAEGYLAPVDAPASKRRIDSALRRNAAPARFGDTFYGDLAKARLAELKQAEAARQAAAAKKQAEEEARAKERERVARLEKQREDERAKAQREAEAAARRDPALSVKPGSGQSFRDCDVCPEMVVVPADSFTMGSPPGEAGRFDNEGPQRRVTIARPLAVGKLEVTFAEWDACVAAGACKHNPHDGISRPAGWGRGKRPVINVSWNDITQQYLPWLSGKTGKAYRLLSEAEWEYVARAGSATRYHFGENGRDLCTYGNAADLSGKEKNPGWTAVNCRDGHVNTASVGSFQPNAFGLYDVHGNVWERVQDCWNDNYSGAPTDGSARETGDCGRRVLRGGSWDNLRRDLRSALRERVTPDYRDYRIGFRVGRTLTP